MTRATIRGNAGKYVPNSTFCHCRTREQQGLEQQSRAINLVHARLLERIQRAALATLRNLQNLGSRFHYGFTAPIDLSAVAFRKERE